MLKGIQRQMVEVRTEKSRLFERAYFVLRDVGATGDCEKNIVEEANRIIDSACQNSADSGACKEKGLRTVGNNQSSVSGTLRGL